MARTIKPAKSASAGSSEQFVRVRIKALEIPPVKDGIVMGKAAPLGVESMIRTLKLMSAERFARIAFPGDSVISDAIVRESVIRKLGQARLVEFITRRIKPLMADNELLMLDMEIEVVVEDTL